MEAIQFGGALFREDPESYIMGGNQVGLIDTDKLPKITPSKNEFNQLEFEKEFGRNMCTCYAGLGALNNCFYTPNEIERHQVSKIRYSADDFNPTKGGYLDKGINIVNDYFGRGIVYKINKRYIKSLLDKGYYVNIGMYVGGDVNKADDDGIFSIYEIDNIIRANLGHSTLLINTKWQDNYKGIKKPNIVEIEDIDKFIKSWIVYENSYVIVPNYVIRDIFINNIKGMTKLEAFTYYDGIDEKLYNKEKKIFQWVLQKTYIGKINSPELKQLIF